MATYFSEVSIFFLESYKSLTQYFKLYPGRLVRHHRELLSILHEGVAYLIENDLNLIWSVQKEKFISLDMVKIAREVLPIVSSLSLLLALLLIAWANSWGKRYNIAEFLDADCSYSSGASQEVASKVEYVKSPGTIGASVVSPDFTPECSKLDTGSPDYAPWTIDTEMKSASPYNDSPMGHSSLSVKVDLSAIKAQSVLDPKVLIGWRVQISGYGTGIILDTEKSKFRTTKFKVQFDNSGEVKLLKLKRSETKGVIPFNLLKKVN